MSHPRNFFLATSALVITLPLPNFLELSSNTNNFVVFSVIVNFVRELNYLTFFFFFFTTNVISYDSTYICNAVRLNSSNLLKLCYPIAIFLKFILSDLSPTVNIPVLFYQKCLFQIIFPKSFIFKLNFIFLSHSSFHLMVGSLISHLYSWKCPQFLF